MFARLFREDLCAATMLRFWRENQNFPIFRNGAPGGVLVVNSSSNSELAHLQGNKAGFHTKKRLRTDIAKRPPQYIEQRQ